MGRYLHKHRSDHVGCAVIGCAKDCCVELVAMMENGAKIYVPGCEQHIAQIHSAKSKLEEGIKPKDVRVFATTRKEKTRVGLSLSELFYVGPGENATQRPPEKQEKARVAKNWKWVEDFDKWMNAAGEVVSLKNLEDKELEDAAILIRQANIKRRTKRVRWITALEEIAPPIKYAYPENKLVVGMEDAYSKLDEFYEECRSRGILP